MTVHRWTSATCTPRTTAACARSRPLKVPNIGLIGSLASYGRINPFGFVETPYRVVKDGHVTNEIHHLTADEEDSRVIAQANAVLDDDDNFIRRPRPGPHPWW